MFLALQLPAERGSRRDHQDFTAFVNQFCAARFWAEEIQRALAAEFEFHEGTQVNRFAGAKLADRQGFEGGDGGFCFERLPGLSVREIGGLQSARVIFIFGLILFVGGLRVRRLRRAVVDFELRGEPGDNFLDERAFVDGHSRKACPGPGPGATLVLVQGAMTTLGSMRSWFSSELPSSAEGLVVGGKRVPLLMLSNPRARRYVLRLRPDGTARVTVPRGGSVAEARRFVNRNLAWLEKQLQRPPTVAPPPAAWQLGTEVLFRGERVRLEASLPGNEGIRLGGEQVSGCAQDADLRTAVESHLRCLAARELPLRVTEFAALHQLSVRRVTVRDQRTRWGSCSRGGSISLNWRLIQTPPFVCDYIILHELMHLREMNHSSRFWGHVERVCPDSPHAEHWLKRHSRMLRP